MCVSGICLVALVTAAVHFRSVEGCARMPPRGFRVEVSEETAIIVWDAANKMEHFIRKANFKTAAPDLGFLVPTPSQPTITEVDQKAFVDLAHITAPRVVYAQGGPPPPAPPRGCGCAVESRHFTKAAPGESAVRVLEEKQVAGQDIAVLEADDAAGLNQWLADHGYPSSPEIEAWLEPYIAGKWAITAFKFSKPAEGIDSSLPTTAVRLSFAADAPVYPYREPVGSETEATPGEVAPRLLRVYLLSDQRMEGNLGAEAKPWAGQTVWANVLRPDQASLLAEQLKLTDNAPEAPWYLTEFEDHSSPRPALDDLYFGKAANQGTVERPPRVITVQSSTADAGMYALALGVAAVALRRRRTSRA
jgi:hypothetical protein